MGTLVDEDEVDENDDDDDSLDDVALARRPDARRPDVVVNIITIWRTIFFIVIVVLPSSFVLHAARLGDANDDGPLATRAVVVETVAARVVETDERARVDV